MPVGSGVPYNEHVANGTVTVFAFGFTLLDSGDLVVTVDGVTKTLTTDYTINGLGNVAGGEVVFLVAPVASAVVVLERIIELERTSDYQALGNFNADTVDEDFDRLWMVVQGLDVGIGRALRVPETAIIAELPAAAVRANKLLAFNSSGDPNVLVPVSGSAADVLTQLADTISASLGDALIGTKNTATGGIARTEHDRNNEDLRSSDFSSLQAACTAAAGKRLLVVGQYTITADISLPAGIEIVGEPGSIVQTATADLNLFIASGVSDVRIRGLKFKRTVAGNAVKAGVYLFNSPRCVVEHCEFEGMQWAGVCIDGSDDCIVQRNYVHDSLASSAGDKFDVVLYRSNRCLISENLLIGGKHGGVLVQDPLASGVNVPTRNKVVRNKVGSASVACNTYGIVVYIGGTDPTYNEVIGNEVENVKGDPAVQAATGTGIYVVGNGSGGTKVHDNNVRNCCQMTTDVTNGPAGITVSNLPAGGLRPTVNGNTVEGMTQGHGIMVVTQLGGAVVSGNVVRVPSSNDGTGAGGSSLMGSGIRVMNASDVLVDANGVRQNGSADAILSLVTDTSYDRIVISNNIARAAVAAAIRVDRTSSFVQTDVAINGNNIRCDGTAAGANVLQLAGVDRSTITGNTGGSNTQPAVTISACTSMRAANNALGTNGTVQITTSGTCTGSYWDKTNHYIGNTTNSGTGIFFERFGDAALSAGTAAIGDRVERLTATVGGAKGWRCTTAGSPGTWTSEGNL